MWISAPRTLSVRRSCPVTRIQVNRGRRAYITRTKYYYAPTADVLLSYIYNIRVSKTLAQVPTILYRLHTYVVIVVVVIIIIIVVITVIIIIVIIIIVIVRRRLYNVLCKRTISGGKTSVFIRRFSNLSFTPGSRMIGDISMRHNSIFVVFKLRLCSYKI